MEPPLPLEEADLETTRGEDELWSSLREDSLLFGEAFLLNKYNEIDDHYDLDDDEEEESVVADVNEETKVTYSIRFCAHV